MQTKFSSILMELLQWRLQEDMESVNDGISESNDASDSDDSRDSVTFELLLFKLYSPAT